MSEDEAEQISSSDAESSTKSDGELNESRESSVEKSSKISAISDENEDNAKSDKSKEDGELEEGEISDSDGDEELIKKNERPRIVALPSENDSKGVTRVVNSNSKVGICKFFIQGHCTWGDNCKYKHVKDETGRSNNFQFGANNGPVPLNSLNTFMPQNEWDRAVRESKSRVQQSVTRRQVDEDLESKRLNLEPEDEKTSKKRKRNRSRSSSYESSRTSSSKKIPSLLDLSPYAPPSKLSKQDSQSNRDYRNSHSPTTDRRKYNSKNSSSTRYVTSTHESSSSRNGSHRNGKLSKREKSPERRQRYVAETSSKNKHESKSKDRSSRKGQKEGKSSKRRGSRSSSGSPVGFRIKNPTRQQIEDYFAERDDEKPAAYKQSTDRLSTSPDAKKRQKRSVSSSSSASTASSSSNASSSSSSASSISSAEPTKKSSIAKVDDLTLEAEAISDSDSEDNKVTVNKPQQISSDEDSKSLNGAQQISSSEDESDKDKMHKKQRTKKSPSPISSPNEEMTDDQREHEDAVLNMDIGDVLDEYESRAAGGHSPVNVS